MLANIYLHYAFALWAHDWRKRNAQGDVIIVRYADDIVLGFEHRAEAEQFQRELSARLANFDLTLPADKTRLLEFGRFAALNRVRRGQGKPATFDFLGFTHLCGQAAKDRCIVLRQTMQQRLRAKLQEIKAELTRPRRFRLERQWLPVPHIYHPFPWQRLHVTT